MKFGAPGGVGPRRCGGLVQRGPEGHRPLFVDLRKDRVAIIKELVGRPGGDLRLCGNHLHGDIPHALALGERLSGIQDLAARALRALLGWDASATRDPVLEREGVWSELRARLHNDLPLGNAG